ncbi:hypothetical protein HYW44_02235 [Candidatus Daviesbacteria bacterium]|nr:hypothetical protein [Candidatus Daviesbacteria bacterium]
MDKIIQKTLASLGLNPKEIKFYETCFKLGPSTVNEIAKQSRLQRSTAYLIAQELIKKGFLQEDLKQYKKKVFALNPAKLLQMLSSKQRLLRRQELELEEALPSLQSQYQSSEIRPKVKVFEGKMGLLQIWNDILSTKGEILCWTNQETENLGIGLLNDKFIKVRIKKGIRIRVLAVNNPRGMQLPPKDSQSFRVTKILPKETFFTTETYIYDNKVAILDYTKDIIGTIIESLPISSAQRAIFELSWTRL